MADDGWSWCARVAADRPEHLTSAQQGLLAVCERREEVNAGDFELDFATLAGGSAPAAIASLPGLSWARTTPTDADARLGSYLAEDPERCAW